MRPWVALLLLTGVAFAAQSAVALPPIITVKNLKAKAGPAYKWNINSKVATPFSGSLYPGQTSTAKVTVDIERSSVERGYVVTGKYIITNPLQNQQPMEITALKAAFGSLDALDPKALDCPARVLEPGQSLPCSFRFDMPNDKLTTMTPIVDATGMPQLQGEVLKLQWPTEDDEDRDMLPHGKPNEDSSCALIQLNAAAGELQQAVYISMDQEDTDILAAGVEVCEEDVTLEYNITVGPLDATTELCGEYMIQGLPRVRFAAGSTSSSTTSGAVLPITIGGCRQKNLLGGHKPAVEIHNLQLQKVVDHNWTAVPVSSTNTSSPATVKYDSSHTVDVSVHVKRTVTKEELLLTGDIMITNTEAMPYLLRADGVRLALSKGEGSAAETRYVTVTCPTVGSNVFVPPKVDNTPGTLACQLNVPIDEAWKKGTIQAQLQTLLSSKHDVDSGLPSPYDFEDKARVQNTNNGECVSLHISRVQNQVDLQSANANQAVASLAQAMGGDKFKLLPRGKIQALGGFPVPPSSQDASSDPVNLCGTETVSWRETYGPFSQYDCGPNMALMGVSAVPTTGFGGAVTATLAFPLAVKHCMLTPELKPVQLRPYNGEVFTWTVQQSTKPQGGVQTPKHNTLPVRYTVNYKRTASLGGFKVRGLFNIVNRHTASLALDEVTYSISRPAGPPITGQAECSGTYDEGYAEEESEQLQPKYVTPQNIQGSTSSIGGSGGQRQVAAKSAKLKMAAVKYIKRRAQSSPVAVAAAAAAALYNGDELQAEAEYEEGGHGPLFCSFEAILPDDYPSMVTVKAVTDERATSTVSLGTIDWSKADTAESNKCAMVSFAFSTASSSNIKPASIDGLAPPALAVPVCNSKQYKFTANFGPWTGPGACGPREAVSVATASVPSTASVVNDENTLHLDIIGCPEPLPTLTLDASQQPVKGAYTWSLVRKMAPVGSPHPVTTVAGPEEPKPDPAVLVMSAKHTAGSHPGAYARFNQTIKVKRTKPSAYGKGSQFEVKGEVRLVNNAHKPLRLKQVQIKIAGAGDEEKATFVKAVCPDSSYDSEYSSQQSKEEGYITIPTTASTDNPIKCQFGAIVSGPGTLAVHAIAVMADDRKAKAKNSVHLELREDFYKPMALGSCVRIQESRGVRDSQSGADADDLLFATGDTIPEAGFEVCKSSTWSFIGRVGPLESYEGPGCQTVTYKSTVTATPSSGYQGTLQSEGIVNVRTSSCKQDAGDGNEDPQQTYKGNGYYSKPPDPQQGEHSERYYKQEPEEHNMDVWEGQEDNQHSSGDTNGQYKHQDSTRPAPGSKEPYPGSTPKGPTWSPWPGSNTAPPSQGGGSKYGPGSSGSGNTDDDDDDGEGGSSFPGKGSNKSPAVPGPGSSSSNQPPSYSAPGSSGGSNEPLGSDGSGSGEYVGSGGPSTPGEYVGSPPSHGEHHHDDDSGEGYEDHKRVDFWKRGSHPTQKETPNFGVTEKLMTSSHKAKATTQQAKIAPTAAQFLLARRSKPA